MFSPSAKILRNYALVLTDFALSDGQGIKEKQVVYLQFDLPAMPLALAVYQRILERNAYPLLKINDEAFTKIFYRYAQGHQLAFFPKKYSKALADTIDHRLYLIAESDPLYLKTVPPKKIMIVNQSNKLFRRWLENKEDKGKFSWSLCLYGTEGMAKQANLSLKEYWQQIIQACFLDKEDPLARWRSVFSQIEVIKNKINQLPIDKIHIKAKQTDLWLTLGKSRRFVGGSGRNIPSFEIFTSPDWRGTEGRIFFDLPLYRYGNLIKDIFLEFNHGRVIKAHARVNQQLLNEIVKQKNADKVGEFSMTDKRYSHINRFMANTLYDENYGGQFGNTHIALGNAYHETYQGIKTQLSNHHWKELGFNQSTEHTDIIATAYWEIYFIFKNKVKKIIYKNGQFVL